MSGFQIKEAYRALAKVYHPDLCGAAGRVDAETRFKVINEARMQLLGPAGWASAGGRAGYQGASGAASAEAAGQAPRFSNGFVAAIISIPLILTGMWMSRTMPGTIESTWRRHGLMQAPVNPWLREDLRAQTRQRGWGWKGQEESSGQRPPDPDVQFQ